MAKKRRPLRVTLSPREKQKRFGMQVDRWAAERDAQMQAAGLVTGDGTLTEYGRVCHRAGSGTIIGMSAEGFRQWRQDMQAKRTADQSRDVITQLAASSFDFKQYGDSLTVTINGDIKDYSSDVWRHHLTPEIKKVELNIVQSPGGVCEEVQSIVDALKGREVSAYVEGRCESAAVELFAAADVRECHPDAVFTIHCSHFTVARSGNRTLEQLRVLEKADERAAQFLAERMHSDVQTIRAAMERETSFDSRQAENEGLVHRVVDRVALAQELRAQLDQISRDEERRLLRKREELRRRPTNKFGTRRVFHREPTNDWAQDCDGNFFFDGDMHAASRPKEQEPSQAVARTITPEEAEQRYLDTLTPSQRQQFESMYQEVLIETTTPTPFVPPALEIV